MGPEIVNGGMWGKIHYRYAVCSLAVGLFLACVSLSGRDEQHAVVPSHTKPMVPTAPNNTKRVLANPQASAHSTTPTPSATATVQREATKDSILGKWRTTFQPEQGNTSTITVTYRADGIQEEHCEANGYVKDTWYTYSIRRGKLTRTFVWARVYGMNTPSYSTNDYLEPPANYTMIYHVKIGGDKLSISMPGKVYTHTFTRVKE